MEENSITKIILDCAYKIHTKLWPWLLEKVYRECLAFELEKLWLKVEKEKGFPVVYETMKFDYWYRLDLLVENKVVVELKVAESFTQEHVSQILTYMHFSWCKIWLLLNFYKSSLKDWIKRLIL